MPLKLCNTFYLVLLPQVALVTHSYSFVTAGINRQGVCDLRDGYHETMRVINIVDSFVTLIVPLALILVMNTMITRNLIHFSRRFKQQGTAEGDYNERSDFILHPLHVSILLKPFGSNSCRKCAWCTINVVCIITLFVLFHKL